MALSTGILREIETVVGKRNVSSDPGICESYRCAAAQSSAHYGPYDHRTPMPQAVVMPGSTNEVQAVIRICNKYKLKYKASTTFWSAHGYIGDDFAIQFDMRRMNGIEIDEKNLTAIVGPYAIGATVQAEAIKYGLTCNIPGVGCSSSVLANTSGWGGGGPSTIYTGNAPENLLCVEWVLPTGEIMVTGSAGAGAGWFSGEGPGIALRGLVRAGHGSMSEMGICTKMSIKLSPWPGPGDIPSEGKIPAYRAKMPDNFKAYALCFPDWDRWANAIMMLNDCEIPYIGHRQFSMFGGDIKAAMLEIITDPDKQLCDIETLNQAPRVQEINKSLNIEVYIVLAGMTPEEMAWKERAVDEILKMYDGWKDKSFLEPDRAEWLLMYFLRMGHKNLNYALCGSYEGHFGLNGANFMHSAKICQEAFALKEELSHKDTFMAATGGDCAMGGIGGVGGGGGPMGWEFFAHFDAYDKESIRKTCEYFNNVSQPFQTRYGLGFDFCKRNESMRRPDGYSWSQEDHNERFKKAAQPAPYIYQWKIRDVFNPNRLGTSYYHTLDPEALRSYREEGK